MFPSGLNKWTLVNASSVNPNTRKVYEANGEQIIFQKQVGLYESAVWDLEIYLKDLKEENYITLDETIKRCLLIENNTAGEWFARLPMYIYTKTQCQKVFDWLGFDPSILDFKDTHFFREPSPAEEYFFCELERSRHLKRDFVKNFSLAKRIDMQSYQDEYYSNNRLCAFELAQTCLRKNLDSEALQALDFVLEDPESCYINEAFAQIENLLKKDKPVLKDFEARQKYLKEKTRQRLTLAWDTPSARLLAIRTLFLQADLPTETQFRKKPSREDVISAILKIASNCSQRKTPAILPSVFNSPMMTPRFRLGHLNNPVHPFFASAGSQLGTSSTTTRQEPKLLDDETEQRSERFNV